VFKRQSRHGSPESGRPALREVRDLSDLNHFNSKPGIHNNDNDSNKYFIHFRVVLRG
jgi:hypothetical protein